MKSVRNAMTTKTKAIYAKRLKDNDYNNLMQKKSVAEIASYLKNDTYFANSLDGINEKALHRGQLEILIRNDIIMRLSSILRYSYGSKTSNLLNTIVIQSEINLILTVIRSFISQDFNAVVTKLPIIIESHIHFDFKELSACRSFDELLEVLKYTPYIHIVSKYQQKEMNDFDFAGLEQELDRYYYESMQNYVRNDFSGENRGTIEDLFNTEVELDNIAKIYRLKKYFKADSRQIAELMTPIYSKFTKRELEDIIDNVDADHIYDRLMNSAYKNYITDNNFMYIEHTTKMISYNMNRHQMYFSNNPDLIFYSYMVLSQVEIENIINIIEGVRYKVPVDQIKRTLMY